MKVKRTQCIVLVFGEKGVRYGTGHQIPRPMAEVLYTNSFDGGGLSIYGCEAFFAFTRRNLEKVERLIVAIEKLRETQFPDLCIGLASGDIESEDNWLELMKNAIEPDKEILEEAYTALQGMQNYRHTFAVMKES